jgi:hypothetical protein
MPEVKLIVDAIRFTYSGVFNMDDFFKEFDKWLDDNGYENDIKKNLEHVLPEGKKMEYVYEPWKNLTEYARATVRLKAIFNNVTEITIERGGYERTMQRGKVIIIIDGFLITEFKDRWWQKPWYVFWRVMWEKFVWKFTYGRLDAPVASGSYSLYNKLMAHFKKYKY